MKPYFPTQISFRAIIVYLVSLALISIIYFSYAMKFGYFVLGIIWVLGFFLLTSRWSKGWRSVASRDYLESIIIIALILRLIWVISSYYFFIEATGIPFEFETADALSYHDVAKWLADEKWSVAWKYFFGAGAEGISDVGYPMYLTILYKLFGPVIIIPRILKVFLSTLTCVLVYKLSARTFNEGVGRIAGIMCALMPNLIIYCGFHLKETEMIFLEVAFIERLDYLVRNKNYHFTTVLIPSLLAGSLFFFRTVLGLAAVFAFVTAILFTVTPSMGGRTKRVFLIGWGVFCIAIVSGGTAMTEVEALWEQKDTNMERKRTEQTLRGNLWAKYATGTVMAPLSLVLPFATMVDVDQQYEQQMKSGGNYIRNFMGFFAILAIYEAIRRKKLREYAIIGSLTLAYIGAVSLSGFSNSERFLLPGLPGLIMMWAYGVSVLRKETFRFLTPWCFIVLVMEIGWAYFKLGSRGLL